MMIQKGKARQRVTFALNVFVALISVPGMLLVLSATAADGQSIVPSLEEMSSNPYLHPIFLAEIAGKQAEQTEPGWLLPVSSEEPKEEKPEQAPAGAYGDVTKEEAEGGGAPPGEYGNVSPEEAGAPKEAHIRDPLRGFNKAMFRFNDKFYFWIMKPVTRGYKRVVPEDFRVLFSNFYRNLTSPIRIVNNFLQLKLKYAGAELLRTVINTTIGVGGLRDCAGECFGIHGRDADFGQTLGFYGAGFGFYIVWPILGPSSVRDTVGFAGDTVTTPTWYISYPYTVSIAVYAHRWVNYLSFHLGEYEAFKKATLDPYVAMRNAYVQNRTAAIAR